MSVLERMPWPEDAPERGACVRVERPEEGLAVIVLDPPHKKLAVFDLPLMRDLDEALDELAKDGSLKGVVITGRAPTSFAAGADVDVLSSLEDASIGSDLARFGQALFGKIAALKPRTVAAVGGPVPGGAYELSLACDRILLADHPSTRLGLPETRLGILPGWGGCQRLPRRVGVPKALAAILAGKLFVPRQALKLGLVDRLTNPEYLARIAADIALGRMACPRRKRGVWSLLIDRNPVALATIGKKVGEELEKKTGGHYPAPPLALKLVLTAPRTDLKVGLEREAQALGHLAVTPQCKSLVTIFKLSEDAKKLAKLPDGSPARAIERGGVVGAGIMGAAIAGLMAEKGVAARLADVARAPLDAALVEHAGRIEKQRKRRRLQPHEARWAIDRLEVVMGLAGFARCEIVIEAVAEKLEIKRSVLGELAAQVAPDAILATNTSSLSVDAIAEPLPRPERVVGMHFFNPVARMPLVEVIRGRHTDDATVAAVARLALKLGKTPVVVKDVAGFLVNRLLGPYLDEAVRLLQLGVEPLRLERLAKGFGMPMGPLELLDEVGLDIASHAAHSLHEAYGERMESSKALERMLEAGLTGKKGGGGFYVYETDRKSKRAQRKGFHPQLSSFLERSPDRSGELPDQAVVDHLVLSMVNEAALCLAEEVVAGPRELDLATVFGMGFPPFHGGLMRYADQRGLKDVVEALRNVSGAPNVSGRGGSARRFTPAPNLVELAAAGGRFHAPA